MLGLIARRILTAIPVLLLVALMSFMILQLIPGDPALAMAGTDASPEQIAALRESLGLNRPLWEQAVTWFAGVLHGDLGRSITTNRPVLDLVWDRLGATLSLGILSLLIAIPFGVGLGVAAALVRGTLGDLAVSLTALLGLSLPSFWVGLMAILAFSVHLGWLPSMGYTPLEAGFGPWLRSLILPALVVGTTQIALLARISRSTMLDVLKLDYVRTARAKGLPERKVVVRHALRNALIPIVTVIGMMLSLLIAGAVVTESVFAIPGIGRLVVQSILARDYPVVQGVLLLTAATFVFINMAVDILYTVIDPRVRYD
jgi:peptide/nickel transport system permease protein